MAESPDFGRFDGPTVDDTPSDIDLGFMRECGEPVDDALDTATTGSR